MDAILSPSAALRLAVDRTGSQSAFARMIGITQPSVWAWLKREKALPAEYVLKVESLTGISRHSLRPDLYPLPLGTRQAGQREFNLLPVPGRVAFNPGAALPPEPAND